MVWISLSGDTLKRTPLHVAARNNQDGVGWFKLLKNILQYLKFNYLIWFDLILADLLIQHGADIGKWNLL